MPLRRLIESMIPVSMIDGVMAAELPVDDRGLAYGDGVFETILLHQGTPVWWHEHLQRLRLGAGRLRLAAPEDQQWESDLRALLEATELPTRCVLKLILTAGGAGRGYRRSPAALPRRLLTLGPEPRAYPRDGIELRWCETRLALQPLLAGLKHLNRLEQVLARSEWSDERVSEGLMCDASGQVVCATAANVFVSIDGQWRTPRLDQCGVAGVCRQQLMGWTNAIECRLIPDDVRASEEIFVCSSVRGILPVRKLDDRRWPVGPHTLDLMRRLQSRESAFGPPETTC